MQFIVNEILATEKSQPYRQPSRVLADQVQSCGVQRMNSKLLRRSGSRYLKPALSLKFARRGSRTNVTGLNIWQPVIRLIVQDFPEVRTHPFPQVIDIGRTLKNHVGT
jgi:hypothetical protein